MVYTVSHFAEAEDCSCAQERAMPSLAFQFGHAHDRRGGRYWTMSRTRSSLEKTRMRSAQARWWDEDRQARRRASHHGTFHQRAPSRRECAVATTERWQFQNLCHSGTQGNPSNQVEQVIAISKSELVH